MDTTIFRVFIYLGGIMRQLKAHEWLELFGSYEDYKNNLISKNDFELKYYSIRGFSFFDRKFNEAKKYFVFKYNRYNLGMINIESQTGKSSKKGKGSGRPKRQKITPIEIVKKEWEKMPKEQLIEILEIYKDSFDRNNIEVDISKIKKSSLSTRKLGLCFNKSKSTIHNLKTKEQQTRKKSVNTKYDELIIKSFKKNKGLFGRKRLESYIRTKFQIDLNYRTIGRAMRRLNLFCLIRRKKIDREQKNTNVKFIDLVNRDYHGETNQIIATDVTYISAPKDCLNNFVFLSVAIDHKSKFVVNYNLSKRNDLELVMEHMSKIKMDKKWIAHSDHGFQYSSKTYVDLIQKNNGVVSMGRVGNSLDNREAEYFFSILKSECLKLIDITKITFNELKSLIDDFVFWYNNERIQSVLNWKTPQECWGVLVN
ncbi:Integrase-recombinase protein (plasmid) [Mycoplasmopsis gallopavonis]|uniref:Integrase-recombinase protein n=2 Tax=Mycoplasmopsis gallopavonis TaxID=76629 RepID=A0A449AYQ8_9BACT|nr:IS3 family transposase [Mycoplasmopsis gallopavonis]VEU72641.1 Integrase-recombinase protein [Mycoplasmopsis gallopavonis]VEU72804.1 Integrase-recombinase protein [Mycoplasmopsis gallopavonis]VEU72889.1 Integrase-recombinase protein [Mycoplasmopsis gallopavonis]VEU73009.1 Integrase-recombinase protein [Mycoplasmopsis gallopavonis]VEU73035.1 Integrase-recombinase protein [Mycoplasmopsis gallopavonis]